MDEKFLVVGLIAEMNLGYKALVSNFNLLKEPYKLTFAITYRCNSRCKTCSIWRKKTGNELSLEEIEKFAKRSDFFSWFNLTGGEPFLRKDIVDIAKAFLENSKNFYLLNTTSNGYTPDVIAERVEEMLSLKIPRCVIVISLDGYREVHEKIKGVKGSWDKAIESFKLLKSLSEEHKNFQTFLGYTISPLNIGQFKKTCLSVKEVMPEVEPKDFHVNLMHASEHYFENADTKLKLNPSKMLQELGLIENMRENNSLNPVLFAQSFLEKNYINLAKSFVKNRKTPLPCKVLQSSIFLDPCGNVFPCTIFNKLLGNIRENNYKLGDIIETSEAKKLGKDILDLKCPNCWTPCEAYQTILGNIFKL